MAESVTGQTWDASFGWAVKRAGVVPISALHDGGTADLEIEIAYRMAENYAVGPPSLALVHSYVIQVHLNLHSLLTPITAYANMARLKERLQEAGFVFDAGRISVPEKG
jgi:hypothetical protein